MQSYSIAAMAQRRAGTTALFPIIHESTGLQRAYLAELRRFLKATTKALREIIIPSYRQRVLTTDATTEDFGRFEQVLAGLLRVASDSIASLLRLETQRHTDRFAEAARRAFGLDLKGIVSAEDLDDYLDQVALRNSGLIKGLSDDLVKRVKTVTVNSLVNGETVGSLQKKLKHELGVADSRARLIARDQTSKLNADLNKKRHTQAGVKKYTWRTSQDERVRKRHKRLDGNVYEYGQATGAEQGLEPGQPIQCRCIAQAVVEF